MAALSNVNLDVAILFEASPGFGGSFCRRPDPAGRRVAILFEASPGFGAYDVYILTFSSSSSSQSSLKRVLVSEEIIAAARLEKNTGRNPL